MAGHRARKIAIKALGAILIAIVAVVDPQADQQPLPAGAIPLRVAAAPFASNDNTASVAVVVEIPAGAVKSDATGGAPQVRLSIVFYDRDRKSVASADPTLQLSDVDTNVLRSVSWIAVPPGVYRLWVGAVETPGGKSGSATTDIEIPDFRQPRLTLSGLTVSTGATPIAGREFAAGSELFLYGEIYDQRSVRGPVRATVTIKSTDGDVVSQTPFERISDTAGHQAYIPLKQLRNGAYVATVEAVSIAPARAQVSRSVAFSVSPQ